MKSSLKDKNILHAVTGSVAAYKAVDIIRRITEQGASVNVIMTAASNHFITPLSLEIASGNRVCSRLFEDPGVSTTHAGVSATQVSTTQVSLTPHITLSRDADLLLIAPATANILGKFANGIADDLLSTLLLSFLSATQTGRGKVVVAPAMNWRMYENPIFQKNLDYLKAQGVIEVPPEEGPLACGEEGRGRMADVETIVEAVRAAVTVFSTTNKDLSNKKVLITAGPTRQYIDTVRFISNRSTGKMGYALARVAVRRGAETVLVSGPSALKPPPGVKFIPVVTAGEMRNAVKKHLRGAAALIMAAAVTDFIPEVKSKTKIDSSSLKSIKLKKAPDILAEIGGMKKKPLLVGFAAEAGNRLGRAREKLIRKGADIMVFNNIAMPGSGFESDTNRIVIIDRNGKKKFPLLTKEKASEAILDRVSELINNQGL